jgi:plastocyanin
MIRHRIDRVVARMLRIGTSRSCVVALVFVIGLLAAVDARATEWFVQSGGSGVAFSPQFITIQAGDKVTFLNLGGNHNAVADDGSFRCAHGCDGDGHGGNGNASGDLWIASVTLTTPGTVGYFCEPHGSPGAGMFGTIDVLAPAAPVTAAPVGNALFAMLLIAALAVVALSRLRHEAADRRPQRAQL